MAGYPWNGSTRELGSRCPNFGACHAERSEASRHLFASLNTNAGILRFAQNDALSDRGRIPRDVPYSARSIRAGSMRTARITGGSAATSAAARMVSAGKAIILGSLGLTW